MQINFKLSIKLLGVFLLTSSLSMLAGITARPCPSNQRSKCEYGQSSPVRNFYIESEPTWQLEVEQYFKDKIDYLPIAEQVEKLKKEVKKLRKKLYDISKKAGVELEDDK